MIPWGTSLNEKVKIKIRIKVKIKIPLENVG